MLWLFLKLICLPLATGDSPDKSLCLECPHPVHLRMIETSASTAFICPRNVTTNPHLPASFWLKPHNLHPGPFPSQFNVGMSVHGLVPGVCSSLSGDHDPLPQYALSSVWSLAPRHLPIHTCVVSQYILYLAGVVLCRRTAV